MSSLADGYGGYADLASAQAEETDYRVHVRPFAGSSIAVIAPHGGGIEQFTSDIARAVAGTDINLYLFEGIRQAGNYAALHLTSHKFDEPRCLALLAVLGRPAFEHQGVPPV
ncbi:poly-gamma-glutamate hydrolase family protein [Ottowia oryzae]